MGGREVAFNSKIFIIHKSHIHSTDQFYEVNIELKDFSSTTSSVGYMCYKKT